MSVMWGLMILAAIIAIGFIALGVVDHRHWNNVQPKKNRVDVPVMFPRKK